MAKNNSVKSTKATQLFVFFAYMHIAQKQTIVTTADDGQKWQVDFPKF